jgi:hypothetical protein
MSKFVVIAARMFPHAELSPVRLGADIERARAFIQGLQRWQLLDCYAIGGSDADRPRAVLVMRASSQVRAASLAGAWSTLSGLEVTVWPLVTPAGVRVA